MELEITITDIAAQQIKDAVLDMEVESPYLNFYVANAYEVTPMPSGKGAAHEIKGTIKIVDLNSVNIYELKLFPSVIPATAGIHSGS